MSKLVIKKINEVLIQVVSDTPQLRSELKEAFSFYVPGYKYMPGYKQGWWDGKINLYSPRNQQIYLGLLSKVKEFAATRNIPVECNDDEFVNKVPHNVESFLSGFKCKFKLRDYQEKALHIASSEKKALFLSSTGSGKSLSIYALIRMLNVPTLLVVPSIQLVGQMYSDFEDYSSVDPDFNVADKVQQIKGGASKEITKPIVISTWQSIFKLPDAWFSRFHLVICDECHEAKAASITKLIGKCTNSEYRYGLTGTLDGTHTHEMALRGLFGDVHRLTHTADLMEQGVLADLTLKQIILRYSDETRKSMARSVYQDEVSFLIRSQERTNFVCKLALRCPGNTLVLFQRVEEHGVKIYDELCRINEEQNLGRKIHIVHGKIKDAKRHEAVHAAETEDGVIICASIGSFARGINIKNLEYLIYAFGLKARIPTLQGIGRSLRIGKSNKATVYDICDDLTWKSWTNYSMRHAEERMKAYQQEKFNYGIKKVQL